MAERTRPDTDGAADKSEKDGFGEELDADVASGGPKRAAQPDLGAALEDRDDHDVGHPDRPDEERHGAETQEEAVEGTLGVGSGDEGGRGLGDVDLAGVLRVGGGTEQVVDGVDVGGLGAHVDGGRVAVEAEIAARRRGSRPGPRSRCRGRARPGAKMPAT